MTDPRPPFFHFSPCAVAKMGFFKTAMLPTARGFDYQSGLYNAQGDHFEHTIDGASLSPTEPRASCGC